MLRFIKKLYKVSLFQNIRKAIKILRYDGIKALSYKIRQKKIQKSQLKKVSFTGTILNTSTQAYNL